MLALRLRGSRSIRAQYSGSSCRAHVVPANITGRGRLIVVARTYATESNKPSDNGSKSSKSTSSKKKKGTDGANDGAKKTESNAEDETLDSESKAKTVKILREATLLLREFQANPAKFAAKKSGGAQGGDESKRSLKTHFSPIKGAPKYDERQTKIFYETLTVLGDALKIVANGSAGRDKITDEHVAAAKEAMEGISTDHAGAKGSDKSNTADTTQKQSSKKKAEPESEKKPQEPAKKKKKGEAQEKPEAQESTNKKKGEAQEKPDSQESTNKKKGEAQEKPEAQESNKKKKGETQEKSESQDGASVKKKGQTPQKPEKKPEKKEPIKPPAAKKTKGKKGSQTLTNDAVSRSIAAAMSNAQSKSKIQKLASKSEAKRKAESRSAAARAKKHGIKVETFQAESASALSPVDVDMKPVPLIQYGLDRVLFKDGVYALQDPRTRVWNFDPYLANIMPVTDFDFDALTEYITSSKDRKLISTTKERGKKYTGSTSSMTSTLAHFHFLLSHWRPINCARLSQQFDIDVEGFSGIMKSPAATILNYKDGVYAIDADKEWDTETVLSMLGKSMEKLLTVPKEEFVKYHRSKSHELTEEEKSQEESYHYTTYGDFMMRSQLDAFDPRLPGTGMYDLKTRAVVSIRMDAQNVEKGVGYEIRQRDGNWESFEREYFDMIRAAFLKYSLQVRMGRMDGIFVAYHNTQRIFGFQYIPIEEMDLSLHGTTDTTLGDREFTASLKLFNELLNQATAKFPKQSLRVHVETRPSDAVPFLYFFAEPVNEEQIKNIQERSKGRAEKFKARLGLPLSGKGSAEVDPAIEEVADVEDPPEAEETSIEEDEEAAIEKEDSDQVWQDMMDVVEDTMDKDAEGITAIREAIQQALEQSGLLRAKSSEEAQHYVEALLKSIIDPDAELAKSENQEEEEDEVVQESTKAESAEPTPEPKQSGIGSLFSWFRPSAPQPETSAEQTAQEATSLEDGAESKEATKDADNRPSPELVELLVKLTSRVGTTTSSKIANDKAKEQELSDDQARLRSFETILLEMMPDVLEPAEEKKDEKHAAAVETADSSASANPPESEAEQDSLFAMYVTVRNKVNDEPVDRPENLKSSDKWDIEYAMEELHGERAEKLYYACMKRRERTHLPKPRDFEDMFDGQLPKYISAGRRFRQQEQEVAQSQPVWIVGQPTPLPATEVFNGAGVKLVHVLPSYDVDRPGAEKERTSESQHAPVDQEFAGDSKEVVEDKEGADKSAIEKAVEDLRKSEENKASSFKEWREKSKQSDKS